IMSSGESHSNRLPESARAGCDARNRYRWSEIIDCYRPGLGTYYACGVSSVNRDGERLTRNTTSTVDMGHWACSTDTRAITKVDTSLGNSLVICSGEADTDTRTFIG